MAERVQLQAQSGTAFQVELGDVLVETQSTVLRRGLSDEAGDLPREMVVKLGKQPADFGRLDLEQVACERLEHPSLARYWGSARTPELGTVLAFEQLDANPLLLLNANGSRPTFRPTETHHYPLPPGIALELAFDVLLALEQVHAQGFVHGGVTLTNLLVRTAPGPGDVLQRVAAGAYEGVLAGLGGARELTFLEALRGGEVDPALTPQLPPLVSAPETLFESSETGGRRVYSQAMDTYAFGLLLYTLLTGRKPYDQHARPAELDHPEVINELKLQEARGKISPFEQAALLDLPLHDSPFAGPELELWPAFHAGARHLILGCLDPDPSKRIDLVTARYLFTNELRLSAGGEDGPRLWVQHMFQWLPTSNRLLGDRPGSGLWIHEQDGNLLVESPPLTEPTPPPEPAQVLDLGDDEGEDVQTTIEVRTDRAPATTAPTRHIAPPYPLRELLVLFRADKELPAGPFLLTNTSLERAALAKTKVHALGSVAALSVVGEDGEVEERIQITVGRSPKSDLVLDDQHVSKRHAVFEFHRGPGLWSIEDVGSSNGTKVGKRKLDRRQRTRLHKSGTKIVFGTSIELTYVETPELKQLLQVVLDMAKRATEEQAAQAPKAAPQPDEDGFLDEMPEEEAAVEPAVVTDPETRPATAGSDAPTRQFRMAELMKPATALVPLDSPWASLARKMMPLDGKATFRILLRGNLVGQTDTASGVLEIVRAFAENVKRVEAEVQGRSIVIYEPGFS